VLGTVLPGTVMPGTVLPGTVMPGTVLLGTVLPGTVLPGTGEQDIGGGPGTAEPGIAKKLGTEECCTDGRDIQTHGFIQPMRLDIPPISTTFLSTQLGGCKQQVGLHSHTLK
jgi:hypothetical protein